MTHAIARFDARADKMQRLIDERGLRLVPFGNRGATRLVGVGVDVLYAPGTVPHKVDLEPVLPRR